MTPETEWKDVCDQVKKVNDVYRNLLKESDKLADIMGYNRDWVLLKVFPRTANERRETSRISKAIERQKEAIEKEMKREYDSPFA